MNFFKFNFIFLLLSCSFFYAHAQQSESYYGNPAVEETFNSVSKTGVNFSLLGSTTTNATDGKDFYLVKTNAQGQQQWTHQWDYFKWDEGTKILSFSNGDVLVVGYGYDQSSDSYKGYYARLDGTGQVVWQNSSSTLNAQDLQFMDAMFTSDGNILILANHFTQSSICNASVVKINMSGALLYVQDYPNATGTVYSFAEKSNGNVLIGLATQNVITIQSNGNLSSLDSVSLQPKKILVSGNAFYISDEVAIAKYDVNFSPIWNTYSNNGFGVKLLSVLSSGNLAVTDNKLISEVDAQTGTFLWTATQNTVNSNFVINDIQEKNASEWVLTGYSQNISVAGNESADGLFYNVSSTDGSEYTHKLFGQTGSDFYEQGYATIPAADGGFVMVGESNVQGTPAARIIKSNASNAVEWDVHLGQQNGIHTAWGVCNANNSNGYVVLNYVNDANGTYVGATQLDLQGVPQWSKSYNANIISIFGNIKPYPAGGYVIATTLSSGMACLIRIDNNGDSLWSKKYNFSTTTMGYDLCVANNGDIVIAGRNKLAGSTSNRSWLMRVDANGNLLWQKTYITASAENSRFTCVVENPTTEDLYAVGRSQNTTTSDQNSFLLKTDANGDSLKSYILQGSPSLVRTTYKVRLNSANEILLFGISQPINMLDRQANITKLSPNFNVIWDKYYTSNQATIIYDGHVTTNDSLVAFGFARNPNTGYYDSDFYLLKTDPNGNRTSVTPKGIDFSIKLYPNPTQEGKIKLEVTTAHFEPLKAEIYDINGRRLQTNTITQNISILNVESLASGTYFVRVLDKDNRAVIQKMIKN